SVVGVEATPVIRIERKGANGAALLIDVSLAPELDAVDLRFYAENLPRPDGGVNAALRASYRFNLPDVTLIHDHPYGVSEIRAEGTYLRKYPSGEWMTSPQWFEEVENPFTALQLLDFISGDRGVLLLHDGSQAFQRHGDRVVNILTLYDPWDEDYFVDRPDARVRLVPHGPMTHARRWRLAQEFVRPVFVARSDRPAGDLPPVLGSVWCDAPGVAVTAFYREAEEAGAYLENYAGSGMGFPYVLRLVEFNGEETTARVRLPGPVAAAYKTNLMGEVERRLDVTTRSVADATPAEWSELEVTLRPHEIATFYVDLVYGRK